MAEVRRRMRFHGRVQGVGFRYTAKYLAQSLSLTGWVKNEYDGTVLMEIQGREFLIHELMKGLNRSNFIQIDWIDTEDISLEQESSFYVR
ncbi:acylphosphatase [Faecalicatena contorta]|uniref:acylphosphatase n=1 Tax=Faecalicatena contorta TaxID=39482 RepID=UPI001F3BF02D|nr:acylphosphatase [Faecalicatena contorta]MCF2683182.1 acylphosphatase [Faecalicatena contorta]